MIYLVSFTQQRLMTKFGDNCKYPLATIQAVQNQKQTNTGGLEKLQKLFQNSR